MGLHPTFMILLAMIMISIRGYWVGFRCHSFKCRNNAWKKALKIVLHDTSILGAVLVINSFLFIEFYIPQWASLILCIIASTAVLLFGYSHWTLKANWGPPGTLKKSLSARVVKNGPYRYFLHPIYVSVVMFGLAFSLQLKSPILIALLMFETKYLAKTAAREERLLLERFGKDYFQHFSAVRIKFPSSLLPRHKLSERVAAQKKGFH